MQDNHQWMPNTLFEMAAFCDKNGLEKARNLLTETAVMLYMCLPQDQATPGRDAFGEAQITPDQSSGETVVVLPKRPKRVQS